MHDAGASDQQAHEAAVAAVQKVLSLSYKEASVEAVNTIAYTTIDPIGFTQSPFLGSLVT